MHKKCLKDQVKDRVLNFIANIRVARQGVATSNGNTFVVQTTLGIYQRSLEIIENTVIKFVFCRSIPEKQEAKSWGLLDY